MIRSLAAALLSLLMTAGAASAQSYAPAWGQPIYLDAWGRPVGGSPLSEVETRTYAETGRWADGHHERPYVRVPGRAPAYGRSYGASHRYDHGYRHGSRDGGYGRRPYEGYRAYEGYRDGWGYQDDRARPGRRGYVGRQDCDCADVYLYDR